jgi:3-oxoacyl-[acyl-carrier-protein] synthase II
MLISLIKFILTSYLLGTCIGLNYVANQSVGWSGMFSRRIALTNSFGFGGTNGSLCISSYEQ